MKFNNPSLFLLSLALPCISYAEYQDPTKPALYSAQASTDQNQPGLKLSMLWLSAHSKRATINGVTVKQGETIFSDIKIIEILKNAVIIEQNGQRRKLFLLSQSYKTQ